MTSILTDLGFEVSAGKAENHKIVTHDHLEGFISTSYDCGHGRNSQIKPVYVKKVARVIGDYADELERYLER